MFIPKLTADPEFLVLASGSHETIFMNRKFKSGGYTLRDKIVNAFVICFFSHLNGIYMVFKIGGSM